jgi:CSLREA domain-containing protein
MSGGLTAGRRILLALPIVLGALVLPPVAGAATLTVNITADQDDTDGGSDAFCDTDLGTGGLQCSLRAAVETADGQPGTDVVELPFDVALSMGTPMQVNNGGDLTIRGTKPSGRSVIDANATSSHIDVFDINLTLEKLDLTDGLRTNGSAGSISYTSFSGSKLRLDDTRVDGNTSTQTTAGSPGVGGGIFALGSGQFLEIVNSTIDGNQAGDATHPGTGGGIFIEGQAPSATITNSVIQGNRAFGGSGITRGGGILVQNDSGASPSGLLTLTDTSVTGNRIGGGGATGFSTGGGIQLSGGVGTSAGLSVTGGSFSGNGAGGGSGNAMGFGGAVQSPGGDPISLDGVTFSANRAGGDDGLADGTGQGGGGAVQSFAPLTVTNSIFSSNHAGIGTGDIPGSAGAIDAGGASTTLTITGSSFDGNQAGSGSPSSNSIGGAVSAFQNGPLTITGSSFTNNTTPGFGGVLERFRDPSTGTSDTITGSRLVGNSGGVDGGAIDLSTDLGFQITSSEIAGNGVLSGAAGGGAIAANSKQLSPGRGVLGISNSTISNNSATLAGQDGGALIAGRFEPIDVNIAYSTIADNHAADLGGNLSVSGAPSDLPTVTLANSIISAGTSTGTPANSNCFLESGETTVTSLGGNLEDTTPSQCGLGVAGDLVGVNPLLGPLGGNGGPTRTLALAGGSPARDHATGACPATDQRGYPRPGLGTAGCDSGAYELSVCNGAAVNDPSPPGSCPPPPTAGGGGGTTQQGTTLVPNPLCTALHKKLRKAKRAHNSAKVQKIRRKLRRLGC